MDWAGYAALYPDGPGEDGFERLAWEAERLMERATTGADGVCKLTAAPPTVPAAVQAAERCRAALVHLLWQMERTEGLTERGDGSVAGRVVTAVTAGSESVTYAAPETLSDQERQARIDRTVERYLAGTPDGNGVNLLYMGKYPVKAG